VIHLAYDGSLNGDWVSRHALRLAAHGDPPRLRVVHVLDGSLEPGQLEQRLARIEREAQALGVAVERQVLAPTSGVLAALEDCLPLGSADVTVCGTRARPRRGFLAGTISERLLRGGRRRVVAIRVVQPGLLGDPRSFLVPLSSNLRGLAAAWPLLGLFLAGAERVAFLHVVPLGTLLRPYVSAGRARALREAGWSFVREREAELRRHVPDGGLHVDGRVVLSNDWPHEVVVQAGKLRARMILMGASERTLLSRALGDPIERILRTTPCDVGVCRSP
jgi:nucleotide-binding universal stress UspA family protein